MFNKGDQRIIDAFQNVQLAAGDGEDDLLGDLSFRVDTAEGIEKDNYDFKVSMDESDFLGFSGTDLRVLGTGKLQDQSDFSFELPIDLLKMEIEWVPEDTEKIL